MQLHTYRRNVSRTDSSLAPIYLDSNSGPYDECDTKHLEKNFS